MDEHKLIDFSLTIPHFNLPTTKVEMTHSAYFGLNQVDQSFYEKLDCKRLHLH